MCTQLTDRSRRLARLIVMGVLGTLPLLLAACGGSSGPSEEQVAHFKRQGAEHVHKEERLRRLERELRNVKHGGSAPVVARNESSPPATPSTSSREGCGEELEVNSYTTCPFAENVKEAYFEEIGSGSGYVSAYSPVTHKDYSMYCTDSPHECTGGHNAAVYFP